MRILVTGGAGFIGSAVVRELIDHTDHDVLNIDALTYAGNLDSVAQVSQSDRYQFAQINICDHAKVKAAFDSFKPQIVMNLAAESHVDRSIDGPQAFVETNIVGSYTLLEVARHYFGQLNSKQQSEFRFHHISTDEVYGDLEPDAAPFSEITAYAPSSPYAASKAASDHLVRAWQRTYDLPVVISNCSNNYGPYHFPEKLVPHLILNALAGKALPIYGDGSQIRDWLYVEDHARALVQVATKGKVGESYNIGGNSEKKNIDVALTLCDLMESLAPDRKPKSIRLYSDLIEHVSDRPGHDRRYAIDANKIAKELGWQPRETFESGLRKTVLWYLDNPSWWQRVLSGEYQLGRLGANQ